MKVTIFECNDDYGNIIYQIRLPDKDSCYGKDVNILKEKHAEYVDIERKYTKMQFELKEIYQLECEKDLNKTLRKEVKRQEEEIATLE